MPHLGLGMGLNKQSYRRITEPFLEHHQMTAFYDANEHDNDAVLPLEQLATNGDFALDSNSDGLADEWAGWFGSRATYNMVAEGQEVIHDQQDGASTGIFRDCNVLENQTWAMKVRFKAKQGVDYRVEIRLVDPTTTLRSIDGTGTGNFETVTIVGDPATRDAVARMNIQIRDSYNADPELAGWMVVNEAKIFNLSLPINQGGFGLGNEPTEAEFTDILVHNNKDYHEGQADYVINPNKEFYWKDYSGNKRHSKLIDFASPHQEGSGFFEGKLMFDGVGDIVQHRFESITLENQSFSTIIGFSIPDVNVIDTILRFGYNSAIPFECMVYTGWLFVDINYPEVAAEFSGIQPNTNYILGTSFDNATKKLTAFLHEDISTPAEQASGFSGFDTLNLMGGSSIRSEGEVYFMGVKEGTMSYELYKNLFNRNCKKLNLAKLE